jgi:hypothetical protein
MIAFTFTAGARNEATRAQRLGKVSIGLIEVADLVAVADASEGANLIARASELDWHSQGLPDVSLRDAGTNS